MMGFRYPAACGGVLHHAQWSSERLERFERSVVR